MFSFIRWIKELSLDISLDDLSACEGYPSLQAVDKLVKARAAFAGGKAGPAPTRSVPMSPNAPTGGLIVALSGPTAARPQEAIGADMIPTRLRSAG